MNEALPTAVALLIALGGAVGGFAALMKVNADNSKTVSEGATNVVKMMREQVAEMGARLDRIEDYADRYELWSDTVVVLLNKVIDSMPLVPRKSFRTEADAIAKARPKRNKVNP